MQQVAVGSTNPVKLNAVKGGFHKVWPNQTFKFTGLAVASGVSAQPLSDIESIRGATTRALLAIDQIHADYGVGLEGGLQRIGQHWFDCGWIVVVDSQGHQGLGSTARIITPPKMMSLILKGEELGAVVDHLFGIENSKQKNGHFGIMTNDAITRTSGYIDGVVMALVRFIHPEIF